MELGASQFLADEIIRASGTHTVVVPLYTVMWGMIGRMN